MTGSEIVERLAVVLSQESGMQLLGIPKIENSTGEVMAEGVYSALIDWNAIDDIVAVSFDTTSSNTGRDNGAIAFLERSLGKTLLKLACRHHIFEIILKAVFDTKFGTTSGPVVLIFQRFRDQWSKIDQTKFTPGIHDQKINDILDVVKADIINFCQDELKRKHAPRDDYKELLDLTIIFLGGYKSKKKINFRQPGPMHHARWMAKAIYCLKIFMFASQFNLRNHELNALRDVCLFVVKFYVKIWFQCTKPLQAPRLDLQFMKDILAYRSIDRETSSVVLKKFRTQSWYLSEELIALAFFDVDVSIEEKKIMVQTFKEQSEQSEPDETTIFRLIIPPSQLENINNYYLHNFITENTRIFFTRYNIPIDFFEIDPSEWQSHEEYKRAQSMLEKIQVVNDHAERAINLIKNFNRLMTKDEQEEQYLLQIISKHQKEDKGISKFALSREKEKEQEEEGEEEGEEDE